MKTNQKTENRNNKMKNVVSRSAAVIVSFVLISFTVSAQGYWKQLLTNNSFGKMAMLMVEKTAVDLTSANTTAPAEAENSTFMIEQAAEEVLELEEWMTNDTHFEAFNHTFAPAVEKSLELEDWMKNDNHFSNHFTVEREEELKLEAWMTDEDHWKL